MLKLCMVHRTIPILLAIVFFALAVPCEAKVTTTTSTEYYLVDGTTKSEILENIKKQSQIEEKGTTFSAYTKSDFRIEYAWTSNGKECTLQSVTVKLHLNYKYPKLSQKQSKSIQKWWNRLYKKLEKHELIHGAISLEYANKMDDELKTVKASCPKLEQAVKRRFDRLMRKLNAEQSAYESLTAHGLHQERYKGR